MSSKNPYIKHSRNETRYVPLKSIILPDLKGGTFTSDQFSPLYFQVERTSSYQFDLIYNELPSLANEAFNLQIELTLLFQRIA